MAGYIGSKSSVTQVDGYTEAEADAEFVNDPNDVITVSGSNVGIGTSSPSQKLHIGGSGFSYLRTTSTSYGGTGFDIGQHTGGNIYLNNRDNTDIILQTNNTERMRIDSSGHLLVGTTDNAVWNDTSGTGGINARSDGILAAARNGGEPLLLNRIGTDGELIKFKKNGSDVGSMGTLSGVTYYAHSNGDGFALSNGYIFPSSYGGARDNQLDIGISWARWDNIWATNGTIQTSDFNEKQDIASLTATEMLVGKRISALFKTFRWKDSVAEKGDNARTHTGVIAQDVQAAFTAEGLDAGDYAMFMSDTWWEHDVDVPAVEAVEAVEAVTETTIDEEGNEVVTVITEAVEAVEAKDAYTRTDNYDTEAEAPEGATERTRLGIRYPELLSFVAAYNEQRFASIEARLTALEA